jgi:TonB family protein
MLKFALLRRPAIVSVMAHPDLVALLFATACCFAQEGWQIERMVGITRYPALARMADIQGTVEISCSIADDGTVRECRARSGNPLLVTAAIGNVNLWKFKRQPSATTGSKDVPMTYTFELLGEPVHSEPRTEFSFEFPNHVKFSSQPACADHVPCPGDLSQRQRDRSKGKHE